MFPPTPRQPLSRKAPIRVRRLFAMSAEKKHSRGGRTRSRSVPFPTRFPEVATFNMVGPGRPADVKGSGSNNVENGTLRRT